MQKFAFSSHLPTRLAVAATMFAILVLVVAGPAAPRGANAVHAAGALTVSAGGPYSGTAGSPISMVAIVTGGATTSPIYSWNFGDGSSGLGASVNHTYTSARSYPYRVTVNVTDSVTGASGVGVTTAAITGP